MTTRGLWVVLAVVVVGCAGAPAAAVPTPDGPDLPLGALSEAQGDVFRRGDELFNLALRPYDGLGPLYTKSSCGECHQEGARGPGLVQKMSLVDADGRTPSKDQSALRFGHTVHPLAVNGATPILPPQGLSLRLSARVGPAVMGRGFMEAIADDAIRAEAAAQAARGDGVHGRVNEVRYQSQPNPDVRIHSLRPGDAAIGRFGLKARIATLDDFTADALQHDMGITSPLRTLEFANPDGLGDDLKPGVDLTLESVQARTEYMRLLAIPKRAGVTVVGQLVFEAAGCGSCHKSDWVTRSDFAIPQLAGVWAPIYSDLLLHDMGEGLSDSLQGEDFSAGPRDWRTTPLIGLRFNRTLMHDGRATTVEQAIAAHESEGSEANGAVAKYRALGPYEQRVLIEFVEAL